MPALLQAVAEIPRYVIVSDFARIALHDLEPDDQRRLPLLDTSRVHSIEFPLSEFHKHIHEFALPRQLHRASRFGFFAVLPSYAPLSELGASALSFACCLGFLEQRAIHAKGSPCRKVKTSFFS